MNYTIRKANENDYPEIINMIKELATFEKAPEQVTNSVEQMKKEKHLFDCLIAENEENEIIGMALYFFAYFTWVGKSLYLDDLYVKQDYRRNRVGSSLLNKIFEVARNEDCKRVRWQVLDWNKPAIDMYKKNKATIDGGWINCDYDQHGILNFKLNK